MKTIFNKLLQIGSTLYGIVYFLGFALPILMGEYSTDKFENISVLTMFLFFAIALILSWIKERTGGILFILWFIGIFILSNFFWTDAGMVLVLSIPILVVGVILFRKGHKNLLKNIKNKNT
jgi:prolipoprotein diacylglyceryltransferase